MAAHKGNWILLVSALVGCALVSINSCADAKPDSNSDKKTRAEKAELAEKFKDKSRDEVKAILKSYEAQNQHVGHFYTVGDYARMSDLSLDKCKEHKFPIYGDLIRNAGFSPELQDYAIECKISLKNFCFSNLDLVANRVLEGLSVDDRQLVSSLAKFYQEAETGAGPEEAKKLGQVGLMCKAYFNLMQSRHEQGLYLTNQKRFMRRVYRATQRFNPIRMLFVDYMHDSEPRGPDESAILKNRWYIESETSLIFWSQFYSVIKTTIDNLKNEKSFIALLKP